MDGLRAVAIVPVVAFHAFPTVMPGGFVGVDVFFVISGYLISLIVLDHLDRGTFTFSGFYARRVRRIFPALVLVLGACLIWGWFRLFAGDYSQLGKHVAGGAGFAANLVLWNEAGYFDTVSSAKPLLHLWSLGIEEQFYLLWPGLLYLTWTRRGPLLLVIAAVLASSFLFGAVTVRTDEIEAFYSPATRLWELLLGAGLAYVTFAASRKALPSWATAWSPVLDRPLVRNSLAGAGLGAIVYALFAFDADTSFPGWRAAIPAGGTMLVVAAGAESWVNRRVLALGPLVWLGLVSYPLYLWHWPLLSFAQLGWGPPSAVLRIALVAASVLLAWLTYVFVERPVRFVWRSRTPVAVLCVLMAVVGVAGLFAFLQEGFNERAINRSDKAHFLQYYERLHKRGLSEAYHAECDFMDWQTEQLRPSIDPSCTVAGERGTVFLWGDSHAQALSHGLRTILPAGVRLAQVTTSGCAPRLREEHPQAIGGRCTTANGFALERIAAIKPDLVVLAQIGTHEATDWAEVAARLRTLGAKRVMLVGPAPQWLPSLPLLIVNHYWDQDYDRVGTDLNPDVFRTDGVLSARFSGSNQVEYVSLIGPLCGGGGCLAVVPATDRQLMAVDSGHLSPAGSIYVADTILRPHVVQ